MRGTRWNGGEIYGGPGGWSGDGRGAGREGGGAERRSERGRKRRGAKPRRARVREAGGKQSRRRRGRVVGRAGGTRWREVGVHSILFFLRKVQRDNGRRQGMQGMNILLDPPYRVSRSVSCVCFHAVAYAITRWMAFSWGLRGCCFDGL